MQITVIDRDGKAHLLQAKPGSKIMEIIRDAGLDIKAECGGSCVCSTCHVYVDDDWAQRLVEKEEEENDVLDDACELRPTSRLSCQILMAEELDGLTVTLAPEWA